jgi:hypothetical protein
MIAVRFAFAVVPAPRGRSKPAFAPAPSAAVVPVLRDAVGFVERGRPDARARAVEGVEVEARGARLQQLRRRDVLTERHVRLVEGQIVVGELPQVREAGGDLREGLGARGHRGGELLADRLGELSLDALRPHP